MNVVAFDTAGPVIGAAWWCNGEARVRTERVSRGAEARLLPWARELAAEAGFTLASLDGVVACHGPGTFTGVRVGLATAVGLAMGLGRPLWTGGSLDSRAAAAAVHALPDEPVTAWLDARKGRVYAATWQGPHRVHGPADVDPEVALGWLPVGRGFLATGEGALVFAAAIRARGGRLAPDAEDPAVVALAGLGAEHLSRGESGDPVAVRPDYLRDADAKRPGEV